MPCWFKGHVLVYIREGHWMAIHLSQCMATNSATLTVFAYLLWLVAAIKQHGWQWVLLSTGTCIHVCMNIQIVLCTCTLSTRSLFTLYTCIWTCALLGNIQGPVCVESGTWVSHFTSNEKCTGRPNVRQTNLTVTPSSSWTIWVCIGVSDLSKHSSVIMKAIGWQSENLAIR